MLLEHVKIALHNDWPPYNFNWNNEVLIAIYIWYKICHEPNPPFMLDANTITRQEEKGHMLNLWNQFLICHWPLIFTTYNCPLKHMIIHKRNVVFPAFVQNKCESRIREYITMFVFYKFPLCQCQLRQHIVTFSTFVVGPSHRRV